MQLDLSRWKQFTAMALIGDGILGMIQPRRELKAWQFGPQPWQNFMQSLEDRPNLTRAISAVQVVGGILWVLYSSREEAASAKRPIEIDGGRARLKVISSS